METIVEKLTKLRHSVQGLESALQEVWTRIEEINENKGFSQIKKQMKQAKKGKVNNVRELETLSAAIAEFENLLDEIPEDGGVAIDLEDAISELIEVLKANE